MIHESSFMDSDVFMGSENQLHQCWKNIDCAGSCLKYYCCFSFHSLAKMTAFFRRDETDIQRVPAPSESRDFDTICLLQGQAAHVLYGD